MIHGFIIYKGYWRKGKKHGRGEFREKKDEKFKEGLFHDGQLLQLVDNFKMLT